MTAMSSPLPRANPDLMVRGEKEGSDRIDILVPFSGVLIELDEDQYRLLQALDGRSTPEQICRRLESDLDVELTPEDVEAFTANAAELGLLSPSYDPPEDHRPLRRKLRCLGARGQLFLQGFRPGRGRHGALIAEVWQALRNNDPGAALAMLEDAHDADPSLGPATGVVRRIFYRAQEESDPLLMRLVAFQPESLLRLMAALGNALFRPAGAFVLLLLCISLVYPLSRITFHAVHPESELHGWAWPLAYAFLMLHMISHELGHALACSRYGRSVPELGIGLMYGFLLIAYADTSAVRLLERRERIVVILAGMAANLLLYCVSVWWLWSGCLWEPVHQGLELVTAAIPLLIFVNLLPVGENDGHHLLAELSGVEDLKDASREALAALLGPRESSDAESKAPSLALATYAVLSPLLMIGVALGIGIGAALYLRARWGWAGILGYAGVLGLLFISFVRHRSATRRTTSPDTAIEG